MNIAATRVLTPGRTARLGAALGLVLALSACHLHAPFHGGHGYRGGHQHIEYGARGYYAPKHRHGRRYRGSEW